MAGRRVAARYLLLGEQFGLEEAEAIGLVSHRAAVGELDAELRRLVEALMAKPPGALRETQRLLRHGDRDKIMDQMNLESSLFAERLASAEVKEAITAFFEKRKPDFSPFG
jgi:enoyl-CoA hydratase/carnithine racemase